ncbi:hypothetical protein CsatA_024807 [Cannabis sativa]
MLDDVIEEIGEHLVVQVVTDNASAYKAAGTLLMEKRKHLYWTPCAAHCIDLMLERIGELPQHASALSKAKKLSKYIYNHQLVLDMMRKFAKRDIVRPAATRFATAFLTLQSIYQVRQPLEAMFTSEEWIECPWAAKPDGKEARKTVLKDKNFWPSVIYAIRTTSPLVEVLRLVDGDKEPAMGFLYNAMDKAKEKIANNLGGEEKDYKEIWEIIDEKWEFQLHRHLHAAAYYLNPRCHYAEDFSNHPEVKLGLFHCMDRLIPDPKEREKADLQCSIFHNKEGFFGFTQAKQTFEKRSPVDWWTQYGDGTPELQKFAIKVLGLTCSASGCERNWSTFNQVHTKKRNRLTTQRMHSLVYIMFNKRLKDRYLRLASPPSNEDDALLLDDLPSDDEWIIGDNENENVQRLSDKELERLELTQINQNHTSAPESSSRAGKRQRLVVDMDEDIWKDIDGGNEGGGDEDGDDEFEDF